MNIFLFPQRIGAFDIITPIFYKIKKKSGRTNLIIFDNKQVFEELTENKEIFDLLKKSSKFIKLFNFNKLFFKIYKLFLLLFFCLTLKNNIFSRSYSGFFEKTIAKVNYFFGGNNFVIPGSISTFEECLRRYYFPNGKLRKEGKILEKKIEQQKGCKMLLFSKVNIEYYKKRGINEFTLVGYPIFYEEFKDFISKNSSRYFSVECKNKKKKIIKSKTISIHINKYFGRWANKTDKWLENRLIKILEICDNKFKNVTFLIRIHPVIKEKYLDKYYKIKSLKKDNIIFTKLHPSSMAKLSFLTIGITTSSTFLHSLSMQTPYIEYAELTKDQLKIFPEGSMHVTFGVLPAKSLLDLKSKLNLIKEKKKFSLFLQLKENHKTL